MYTCVVGDPEDLCAAYIGWLARQRGAEPVMLAEQEYGLSWSFELEEEGTGFVMVGGECLRLDQLGGVFVRFNPTPPVSDRLGIEGELQPIYTLERRSGLQWLLDQVPVPVVNRPSAGRSNSSKPYQMLLLEKIGFSVPRWVATNDRAAAADLISGCGGAVYKSCSGLRSRVRRADQAFLERLGETTAPAIVQQYVPGSDVRVHVVGERTFAAELRSEATDYRFDDTRVEYRRIETPGVIADLCLRMAALDALSLAGFDFRIDGSGTWWCLEMNPVPTFLPYEAGTGAAIGDAILDLLNVPAPAGQRSISPLLRLGRTEHEPGIVTG